MSKQPFFFACLILLLSTTAVSGHLNAQVTTVDSLTMPEPPFADSIAEEYYDDYDVEETYEDSVKRAKANAFDTLTTFALPAVSQRNADSIYIEGLRNSAAFGYVKNGIPKPEEEKYPKKSFDFNTMWLYVALAAFIIFLVWYLLTSDILLLKKKKPATLAAAQEVETKDIFSIDYTAAISNAVAAKNYRLAVRLHYLQLLKMLSEKNIIQYQPDKTNFDYLLQLRPTPYYKAFFNMTRHYEYSWYGLFPIDEGQYHQIRNSFSTLTENAGI